MASNYLTPDHPGEFGARWAAPGKAPEKLKQAPTFFDASRPGSRSPSTRPPRPTGPSVPYFQVSREGLKLDGSNPTLLYGYGGFEISMVPGYNATGVGSGWMEKGGVYVVANIRGGGEFGPKWHQRGPEGQPPPGLRGLRRHGRGPHPPARSPSPAHLGIQGGSNGGLLMGNMLTRRPDLFGAVVCQVPLLDMSRYHTLLAGASWMGEYGNPDVPEEWEFIKVFSPYHNLKEGTKYPRTLFTTSTRDDRVHPGHARKMAAKMKGMGLDLLYYENIEGGHGGAADNKQSAFMSALAYTFLWDQLK